MDADRLALDQHRLESLNAEAVKSGSAVEQHGMLADDVLEDVPDGRFLRLDELLGLLDRGAVARGFQAVIDERLEQLERHLLRQAALVQLQFGTDDDDGAARIVHALAEKVLAEAALLALEGVGERFERRLFVPRRTRPRRPLSNSASTASCSMRFSLRTITSGACSSMSFFKRLLRLITRRYKSFRSEVAKRPPSRGTSGRSSGGRTGITSRIIHSGLLPLLRNASRTFRRLANLIRFCRLGSIFIFSRNSSDSLSTSTRRSNSLMASAPIP